MPFCGKTAYKNVLIRQSKIISDSRYNNATQHSVPVRMEICARVCYALIERVYIYFRFGA